MNKSTKLWTTINATVGIATLALTLSGCDTARNSDRSVTDPRDSAVDSSRTNSQQPGTAPSPSSMDDTSKTNSGR